MPNTRFDDRCDVNFFEESRGIIEEKHYSKDCKPIDFIGIYKYAPYFDIIRWKVKAFYRKCICKRYENQEEIKFPIKPIPHEGVDIHDGPDCTYEVKPNPYKNGDKSYTFILHCNCSRKGKGRESRTMVDMLY